MSIHNFISHPLSFLDDMGDTLLFCSLQVLSKIRNYLQLLGRRIDEIVLEHEEEPYRQDSMLTCLIHLGCS